MKFWVYLLSAFAEEQKFLTNKMVEHRLKKKKVENSS